MAITVRTPTTGTQANTASAVVTAPTGSATNDVGFIFVIQTFTQNATPPTFTTPSGWTALINAQGFFLAYRVRQVGDASSVTVTSNQTNFVNCGWSAFAGCDTTTPIDVSASWLGVHATTIDSTYPVKLIAPSVAPTFAADLLFCVFGNSESGGHAIPLPSGMTSRLSNSFGPDFLFATLALTDGSQTGQKVSTMGTADPNTHFAASIALKASGASAATQSGAVANFAGIYSASVAGNSTVTVPLSQMAVQANDLIVFLGDSNYPINCPPGWAPQSTALGAQIFTRRFQVGDPDPVFGPASTADYMQSDTLILRASHGGSAVGVDQISVASGTTSATTPSLTPGSSTDLLVTWIATPSTTGGGTWTGVSNTGLTEYLDTTYMPASRLAWRTSAPSPSGAYVAGMSSVASMYAATLLFAPGASGGVAQNTIGVRGTAQAQSAGSTSATVTVPASAQTGDFLLLTTNWQMASGFPTPPTITPPSGWTVLLSDAGMLVAYRIRQAGDASSVTATYGTSGGWLAALTAYGGVDTSAPIDNSGYCLTAAKSNTGALGTGTAIAPSVAASHANGALVLVYSNSNGTGIWTGPAGSTARTIGGASGLLVSDKALTDGSATGEQRATVSLGPGYVLAGIALALKGTGASTATQAAAKPVLGLIHHDENGVGTAATVPFNLFATVPSDLLIVMIASDGTYAAPSGWTKVSSTSNGCQVFTATATGTTAATTFTVTGGSFFQLEAAIIRASSGATAVSVDQVSFSTGAGTVSAPRPTPAGSADLALMFIGGIGTASGTWSAVTNTGWKDADVMADGPAMRFAYDQDSASPNPAYSATWTPASGSNSLGAMTLLAVVGSGGGGGGASAQAFVCVMA